MDDDCENMSLTDATRFAWNFSSVSFCNKSSRNGCERERERGKKRARARLFIAHPYCVNKLRGLSSLAVKKEQKKKQKKNKHDKIIKKINLMPSSTVWNRMDDTKIETEFVFFFSLLSFGAGWEKERARDAAESKITS